MYKSNDSEQFFPRLLCDALNSSFPFNSRVLNNYLLWQTVRSFTPCLSKPFRDAYKGLRKALTGSDGGEEPWRYCVSDTNNAIGFAIGAMFVREVFQGEAKPQAEDLINSVRLAFKDNLKNLQWMDPETRILANEKADAISDMIGFPDYILNPQLLDDRYKMLEFDPNNYFENNVKLNVFNLKENLEKLDQPVNKTKWGMTPSEYFIRISFFFSFEYFLIFYLLYFVHSNSKCLLYTNQKSNCFSGRHFAITIL